MKCSFCEKTIATGSGQISVKADGTINYFCDSKCERNSKIRLAKNVRWTGTYQKRKAFAAEEESAKTAKTTKESAKTTKKAKSE